MLETGSETVYLKAFPEKLKPKTSRQTFPKAPQKKHLVRDYIGSNKTKTPRATLDSFQIHSRVSPESQKKFQHSSSQVCEQRKIQIRTRRVKQKVSMMFFRTSRRFCFPACVSWLRFLLVSWFPSLCCAESEDSIDEEINSLQQRLYYLLSASVLFSHRDPMYCTLSF